MYMTLQKKQLAQFSYNFYLFIILQKKTFSKFNFGQMTPSNHVICVNLKIY